MLAKLSFASSSKSTGLIGQSTTNFNKYDQSFFFTITANFVDALMRRLRKVHYAPTVGGR